MRSYPGIPDPTRELSSIPSANEPFYPSPEPEYTFYDRELLRQSARRTMRILDRIDIEFDQIIKEDPSITTTCAFEKALKIACKKERENEPIK